MTNEQPTYFCTTDKGQRGSALFAGIRHVVVGLVFCVYAIGASVAASDQSPVIGSLSRNGELVCTNLTPGTVATVEWAPSATGPWTHTWTGLDTVPVDSDGTIRVSVPMFYRVRGVPASASMVLIPAGTFTMGNCMDATEGEPDELPLHIVQVSEFFMDRYEVSNELWDEVAQWATNRAPNQNYDFDTKAAGMRSYYNMPSNHPVRYITWSDAVKWCNARSEKEGRVPAYYIDAAQTTVYRTGQIDVQNDWVNWHAGYRLPTESEWEKAARGGSGGHRFPWTDTDEITHDRANYSSSSQPPYDTSPTRQLHPDFGHEKGPTSPVGYFMPNGYGLYDMAGNVGEWCWDWHGPYTSTLQTDPRGPPSSTRGRVFRPGSWGYDGKLNRTAERAWNNPWGWDGGIGFRTVLPFSNDP